MKTFTILAVYILMFSISISQDSLDPKFVTYRPATQAGKFYPANADSLRELVKTCLDTTWQSSGGPDILAIAVPHAGYIYSGYVAGKAYRELIGRRYDDIIIIGPSHQKSFRGSSVFNGEAYTTPLGIVKTDQGLSLEIAKYHHDINLSLNGHSWLDTLFTEHSIEVQLPFLQTVLPGVPIVPIIMGNQSADAVDALSKAIVQAVRRSGKKVLLVASTDLSHFHDYTTAREIDVPLVRGFQAFDYFKIQYQCSIRKWEACGYGPLSVAMISAEQLGGNFARPVSYATSANSPLTRTDRDRVVGYFSGIIYHTEDSSGLRLPDLEPQEKEELKTVAFEAVKRASRGDTSKTETLIPRELTVKYPVFVTITKNGKLRGCMGHTITEQPLYYEVEDVAQMAGRSDPRFKPLDSTEIPDLKVGVTILSRFKKIEDYNQVTPGLDGVYLKLGGASGLFLPQVAPENNWDRTTLLEHLGQKAGLSKDAYKNPDAELYIFHALKIE